jgi:hypothetical protein
VGASLDLLEPNVGAAEEVLPLKAHSAAHRVFVPVGGWPP